jgi:hypothetical protein
MVRVVTLCELKEGTRFSLRLLFTPHCGLDKKLGRPRTHLYTVVADGNIPVLLYGPAHSPSLR